MNWLTVKNPVRNGIICILVGVGVVLAALVVPQLILKVKTNEYHAVFANATGLTQDDPVNVAGVPSGVVTSLAVSGNSVEVTFRLDDGVPVVEETNPAFDLTFGETPEPGVRSTRSTSPTTNGRPRRGSTDGSGRATRSRRR